MFRLAMSGFEYEGTVKPSQFQQLWFVDKGILKAGEFGDDCVFSPNFVHVRGTGLQLIIAPNQIQLFVNNQPTATAFKFKAAIEKEISQKLTAFYASSICGMKHDLEVLSAKLFPSPNLSPFTESLNKKVSTNSLEGIGDFGKTKITTSVGQLSHRNSKELHDHLELKMTAEKVENQGNWNVAFQQFEELLKLVNEII